MDLTFILPFVISASTTLIGLTWGISKKEESLKDRIDDFHNKINERITLVDSRLSNEITDIRHKKELNQREFGFFQARVEEQNKLLSDRIETNFDRIYRYLEGIKEHIKYDKLEGDKPTWGNEKK